MPEDVDGQELGKARSFFERARQFAERKNLDYAIDMYLDGLKHAPDALEEGHLPLCELGRGWQEAFDDGEDEASGGENAA